MNDIRAIIDAYQMIGWHGLSGSGYPALNAYTIGTANQYEKLKHMCFAANYEKARDYSVSRGGETVENIVVAVEEYGKFCGEKPIRKKHLSEVRRQVLLMPDTPRRIETRTTS